MKKHVIALMLAACGGLARAHEGHGLAGLSHWHATDTALLLAMVAAGLWLARRK